MVSRIIAMESFFFGFWKDFFSQARAVLDFTQ